jgi:uncharacterized protein
MNVIEFLKFIITSIVKNANDVEIEQKEDELGTLLMLKLNKEDIGSVIGKDGKTINAIRTILRVF